MSAASPVQVAQAAGVAARKMAVLSSQARIDALTAIHAALSKAKSDIIEANSRDLKAAVKAAEEGTLSSSLIARLDISKPGKYEDMLQGILDVRDLPDPVGKVNLRTLLDTNLTLTRITCPIGVLLVIFEARPEVIANITSLSLKTGNAAILKGGSESTNTFVAISSIITTTLATSTAIPPNAIQLLTSRATIPELLNQDRHIDLVIPRGGNALVRSIKSATRIPVLGHADGLCSAYLHESLAPSVAGASGLAMATKVLLDAKTSYPAACNSIETLLVDASILSTTLPPIAEALIAQGVTLFCDPPSHAALSSHLEPHAALFLQTSTPEDYNTEFLALTLAVKTIPSATQSSAGSNPFHGVDLAIQHINTHGSHHTDCILTAPSSATSSLFSESTMAPATPHDIAERFLAGVDSAGVMHNASTRMADGRRYGFGTEVGVSTNKIHARGPVGVEGLMSYRYVVRGGGEAAGEYGEGEGLKRFRHEALPLEES